MIHATLNVNTPYCAGRKITMLRALTTVLLALCLAACATPYRYPAGKTSVTPALLPGFAVMNDGYSLPVSSWLPEGKASCRAVLLALHGLNDYRNAFSDVGPFLAERGVTVYAYDQRGFGESVGAGYWHGWERLSEDLRGMVKLLRNKHPGCPLYVLGESMGGGVVLAAQGVAPLDIEGEILVAPAIWSRKTMPMYQRAALWLAVHTVPGKRLTGEGLELRPSDNIEMLRALGRDPKVIKATRVDVLYGITNLMDVAASVPATQFGSSLLLYGEHDEIIPRESTCRFLDRLQNGATSPQVRLYPKGYHMLTRDLNAQQVLEDIAGWLLSPEQHIKNPQGVEQFCNA
ncbi:Lysophospholipase [hydrothermal vent metagenome]|uniref:Lysophospholipase n=1 Tax=hydrothermal vent metagenome TaxID=652676 RepID=A0A3B0YNB7_9ZZZZ